MSSIITTQRASEGECVVRGKLLYEIADDANEEAVSSNIIDISWIAKERQHFIQIMPTEKRGLRLGMTIAIQVDD